jgi:hypothetical protein
VAAAFRLLDRGARGDVAGADLELLLAHGGLRLSRLAARALVARFVAGAGPPDAQRVRYGGFVARFAE